MAGSSRAKRRGPGRPFQKGDDPNRAPFGKVSRKRAAWMTVFLNELAEELEPKEAAKAFAKRYKAGIPFFVGEGHERLGGKVTQPVDGDLTMKGVVTFVMPRPEDKDK